MVGKQNLLPDLVIQKFNEIITIDVIVPFENGVSALEDASKRKINKFDPFDY